MTQRQCRPAVRRRWLMKPDEKIWGAECLVVGLLGWLQEKTEESVVHVFSEIYLYWRCGWHGGLDLILTSWEGFPCFWSILVPISAGCFSPKARGKMTDCTSVIVVWVVDFLIVQRKCLACWLTKDTAHQKITAARTAGMFVKAVLLHPRT